MQDFNKKHQVKTVSQKGVSLIELLIAMTLGIIVIMGVSQSLSTMVVSSRLQEQNSAMQQTADMTLSYIDYRLRSALATPCANLKEINDQKKLQISNLGTLGNNTDGTAVTTTTIKTLIDNSGIAVNQSSVNVGGNVTTTDNLTTVSTGDKKIITSDSGISEPNVTASGQFTFKVKGGDDPLYVITDCKSADIFRAAITVSNATPATTTLNSRSGTTFDTNYRSNDSALVAPLEVSEIAILNGAMNDRTIYDAAGVTLIDDVELLRILFGIDTDDDGKIDQYNTASELAAQLTANNEVVSAELYLLVRAPGGRQNFAVNNNYSVTLPNTSGALGGGAVPTENLNFTDRVMRKVFTRTVTFRNNVSL